MGAGFALQLKEAYPLNYRSYVQYCATRPPEYLLGECLVSTNLDKEGLTIVNAFGQEGFSGRRATSYDALDDIFYDIYHSEIYFNQSWNDHIHMPLIGSGLGRGDWNVIEKIILGNLPADKEITVWIL